MRPVYWSGLVLWMSPAEYARVKDSDLWGTQAVDPTDAQIEAQDQWYETTKALREQEAAEWQRLADLFNGRRAPATLEDDR